MTKGKKGKSPLDTALAFLALKPRTVREVEAHLDKSGFGEHEVQAAVERLRELNYLDDERYAHDFVSSRLSTKPVSRRKLMDQLKRHKLPEELIIRAVSGLTNAVELENARAIAEKYKRQFAKLTRRECDEKVMKRLYARGYDFSVIREIIGEMDFDVGAMEDAMEKEGDEGF